MTGAANSPGGSFPDTGELKQEQFEGILVGIDVAPFPGPGTAYRAIRRTATGLVDAGGNVIRRSETNHKILVLDGILRNQPDRGPIATIDRFRAMGYTDEQILPIYERVARSKGLLPADYGPITLRPNQPPAPDPSTYIYYGSRPSELPGMTTTPVMRHPDGRPMTADEIQALISQNPKAGLHQEVTRPARRAGKSDRQVRTNLQRTLYGLGPGIQNNPSRRELGASRCEVQPIGCARAWKCRPRSCGKGSAPSLQLHRLNPRKVGREPFPVTSKAQLPSFPASGTRAFPDQASLPRISRWIPIR